ncbi:MAG: hypothetical protein Q9168_008309 [Polycauliona sp. 1 TL-2023]
MERKLGYKVDVSNYPNESVKRFYPTLRLVPGSIYEKALEEFDLYTPSSPREHGAGLANLPAMGGVEDSPVTELDFSGSIGDLRGIYFPLVVGSALLAVNQQMREEALPLVYRNTSFEQEDVDGVVNFLLGIGHIGRENIESLAFGWESPSEIDTTWDKAPDKIRLEDINQPADGFFDPLLQLPVAHVATCLQLLKECNRLTSLRLRFEQELINLINPSAFKANEGIRGLASLRGLKKVEFQSLGSEPLDHEVEILRWLKQHLESPVL